MKLYNKSQRIYQHSYLDKNQEVKILNLLPKTTKEIPDEVAEKWLNTGDVVEYVKPEEAKAVEAELKAENEALKKELEALKAKKADKEDKAIQADNGKEEVKTAKKNKK